jgi:hypothetical protein
MLVCVQVHSLLKITENIKMRFTVMNTDGKELKSTEWTTFESPFKNDRFGR